MWDDVILMVVNGSDECGEAMVTFPGRRDDVRNPPVEYQAYIYRKPRELLSGWAARGQESRLCIFELRKALEGKIGEFGKPGVVVWRG